MQVLINHLDNAQKIHTPRKSKPLNACIISSLTKLREYYRLLDSCPAYAAAQVFNPARKESHFERDWRGGGGQKVGLRLPEKIFGAFGNLSIRAKCLNTRYPNVNPPARSPNFPTTPNGESVSTDDTSDSTHDHDSENDEGETDLFGDYIYQESGVGSPDKYDIYCQDRRWTKTPSNLFMYWESKASNFPSMAQMAFGLLSIPAMSAECERVFSSCKILLSDWRNRLKPGIIEAIECVRYWNRKGYCEQNKPRPL
jgi:hAT family C-terminal dimerisation region